MSIEPATLGGYHPSTAALKNVLATQGVRAPHTNQPFTEAMLLGIGGGLGAGYILWEFQSHESAIIVLGFCNRWNYPTEHLTTLCKRLGATAHVQETGGVKVAWANLQSALDAEKSVIAWVDKAHLPHQRLPESLKGHSWHLIGVYGIDGGAVMVDDLAGELFAVPLDIFAAGRARIGSDKNRLLTVDNPSSIDLPAAIRAGIAGHIEHLGRDSESFSLPVYRKWAKLMTDSKNKKGWPTVFKNRKGLYGTLRSIFEVIVLDSTEGCGLRGMYADFLIEAAPVINQPALKDAASQYRATTTKWLALAEAALPDSTPVFRETKALMRERYDHYKHHRLDKMVAVSDKLETLLTELNADFPLDDAGVNGLYESLAGHLNEVYDAEVAALSTLKDSFKT